MAQDIAYFAGIDISKDNLDTHVYPGDHVKQFSNNTTGWRALAKWLSQFTPERVVYEATGVYHKDMERALANRSMPIVRVNPRRARRFAEALGTIAKTDRVDAYILARFGAMMAPEITVLHCQAIEELSELQAARRALIRANTAQNNRSKNLKQTVLKRQAKAMLKLIEAQIKEIDSASVELIGADEKLKERYEILLSIPGIGPPTAIAMIVLMPELGSLDEGQVASLAGLAPIANDSGTHRGKRVCKGGRANLRQALYMPALVAARFNADLKEKYDKFIEAKKPAKVAITALMRKLLVLANALLRDNRKWLPVAP